MLDIHTLAHIKGESRFVPAKPKKFIFHLSTCQSHVLSLPACKNEVFKV